MKSLAAFIPFILASCAGAPIPALAGEWWIQGHIASKHFKDREIWNWNETNPGIGIRYVDENFAYQVGTFRNSVSLRSTYAFVDWRAVHSGIYSVGAFGGVSDGYYPNPAGIFGMGGFYLSVIDGKSSVTLRLVPPFRDNVGFVAIEFGKRFW